MKLLAALLLCALALPAQQEKDPKGDMVSKSFEIKNGSVERMADALKPLVGYSDNVRTNPQLKIIIVRTYKELMPAVEEVIHRLDVPTPPAERPKNVELTIYMLQATQQGGPDQFPADLQPVVKQLKSAFAYQGFRLLDAAIIRSREEKNASVQGVLSFNKDENSQYDLVINGASVTKDEKGYAVRVDRLILNTRVPVTRGGQTNYFGMGLQANVDVREGQKVVVGKTGIQGADSALILVLSAKVID